MVAHGTNEDKVSGFHRFGAADYCNGYRGSGLKHQEKRDGFQSVRVWHSLSFHIAREDSFDNLSIPQKTKMVCSYMLLCPLILKFLLPNFGKIISGMCLSTVYPTVPMNESQKYPSHGRGLQNLYVIILRGFYSWQHSTTIWNFAVYILKGVVYYCRFGLFVSVSYFFFDKYNHGPKWGVCVYFLSSCLSSPFIYFLLHKSLVANISTYKELPWLIFSD